MHASDRVVVMNEGRVLTTARPTRCAGRARDRRLPGDARVSGRRSSPSPSSTPATSRRTVLRGVSMRAAGRDRVVIGPNGAGQSTFLKAISGLVRPRAGTVRLAAQDVDGQRPDRLTRLGLELRAPARQRLPEPHDRREPACRCTGAAARARARERCSACSTLFPLLRERSRQRAGTLSGGQRKLVALARALVTDRAAAARRAVGGARPAGYRRTSSKSSREIRELGIAIVIVEQNARRALALADRGYVLDMGRNVHEGTGTALLHDPRSRSCTSDR